MNIEPYNISQAEKDFRELTIETIDPRNFDIDNKYRELRLALLDARDRVFTELELDGGIDNHKYEFDLSFGIEVYNILKNEYKLSNRQLSNDDVWRFINIRVVPDILHARWGFREAYYFRESRRLYMKRIFWYIELAWCGDSESTFKVLENNDTDVIAGFVERPGLGYDVPVYKEILKQIYLNGLKGRESIRPILKLHTARLKVVSPYLVTGGIQGYVEKLIEVTKQ
ncbi:hypothetical protein [Enterococcus sp. N342-3-1-2]